VPLRWPLNAPLPEPIWCAAPTPSPGAGESGGTMTS